MQHSFKVIIVVTRTEVDIDKDVFMFLQAYTVMSTYKESAYKEPAY